MAEPRCWIDVFTPETWQEFLAAGGEVSGFPHRMRKTVAQINEGDRLLCYVAGISRWIGALEVVGGHFSDTAPIWSASDYPERVRVRRLIELTFLTAVPTVDLNSDMEMFASLANPNQWSIFFRRSPSPLGSQDAMVVLAALEDARRNPIERPIPAAKLAPRPRREAERTQSEDQVQSAINFEAEEEAGDDLATMPQQTSPDTGREHTEMQLLLLRLGTDMGLRVWAPKSDRGREWNGHTPGEVSAILEDLPLQFDALTMRAIKNIDVLWLQGHSIVAAFEIENSTSIYSGLLRMSDLLAMQPNLSIPLFIVAPDDRREKVFREVNRPTFDRRDQPLKDVCQFIAFSVVRDGYDRVKTIATSLKPSIIYHWAEVCDLS